MIIHAPQCTKYTASGVSFWQLQAILREGAMPSLEEISWDSITEPYQSDKSIKEGGWKEDIVTALLNEYSTRADSERKGMLPNLRILSVSGAIPLSLWKCIGHYNTALREIQLSCSGLTSEHVWTILYNNQSTLSVAALLRDGNQEVSNPSPDEDTWMAPTGDEPLNLPKMDLFAIDVNATWLHTLRCSSLSLVRSSVVFSAVCLLIVIVCNIIVWCCR
jgi:hypothetical protein